VKGRWGRVDPTSGPRLGSRGPRSAEMRETLELGQTGRVSRQAKCGLIALC